MQPWKYKIINSGIGKACIKASRRKQWIDKQTTRGDSEVEND